MKNFYAFKIISFCLLLASTCAPLLVQAQQLGFANSNFMGTHSLYRNPSAIADARQSFYLNLFSVEVGATNNYFRYESPVSLLNLLKNDLSFKDEYLKETLNGKPKLLTLGAELRGPALMIRLSSKHSFGLTTRLRGGIQINNLSEDIARLYKVQGEGGSAEEIVNQVSENNTFNLNANVYSEVGFSYARVIFDQQTHFLKGGITLKKLAGGYSAHLINEDTQFRLREDANDNYTLELNRIKAKYGYINEEVLEDKETVSDYISMLTGKNSPGKGWGADIGFTYEYRLKWEKYRTQLDGKEVINQRKNKYKYRVGISLMDIGGINYKNSPDLQAYSVERENKTLALQDFEDADGSAEFTEVLNNALDITDADRITSFRAGLPTTLNVNLDYNIAGPLYANAAWIQDLRSKNVIGMHQFSLLAVTPRIEFRTLEIAAPVALQNNYSVLTVGAMLKFGPYFIGSDNIGGALNMGKPYGANVYTGFAFSFANKKNQKDKDKDGVSDRIDKCKKIPGTWELMGCPDKDKDGIIDAEDACPEVAGTIALRGCPPPANVVKEPVSAPTQPESKPEPDPIQTPVPVGLIKSAVDSLDKPIPDSLSKPVTDSLNSALLDSLHKAGSSSFNHMNLGASKPSISEAANSSSLNKTFGIIPVATTQTTSANKSENNPHSEPLSKPENTPGDIAAPAPKKASKASTEIDKLEH